MRGDKKSFYMLSYSAIPMNFDNVSMNAKKHLS